MRANKLGWIAPVAVVALCGVAYAANPADEAWKAYQSYREVLAKAASIDELVPLLAAERAAQVKDTPEDQKGMMFSMVQEMSKGVGNLEVVGTSVQGDTIAFEVKGTQHEGDQDYPLAGTVTMVREDGAFKVSEESFKIGDSSSAG